jgi:hypothetical protein
VTYRLPYRDDTFDGADDAPAGGVVVGADVAAARARLDQANAAWRQAVIWHRTARPSNREARKRHLDACLAEALTAAQVLRRAGGAP